MFWIIIVLLTGVQLTPDVSYETNVVEFEEPPYVEVISLLREPTRKGSWEITPTVFVCRSTPITRGRVYQAMRLWQRLGYELEGPFMNSEIPACTGESDWLYRPTPILEKHRRTILKKPCQRRRRNGFDCFS